MVELIHKYDILQAKIRAKAVAQTSKCLKLKFLRLLRVYRIYK